MPKVLIVDDSAPLRNGMKTFLTNNHYSVIEATDGRAGLRTLAQDPLPDIVLADYNMPNMNGYDMTREIRTNPRTIKIPIIGIGDFPENKREYLTSYKSKLTSPPQELLAEIDRLTGRKSS